MPGDAYTISETEWHAGVSDGDGQDTESVVCVPQLAVPEEGPATGSGSRSLPSAGQ
jgi:hypothetical protein